MILLEYYLFLKLLDFGFEGLDFVGSVLKIWYTFRKLIFCQKNFYYLHSCQHLPMCTHCSLSIWCCTGTDHHRSGFRKLSPPRTRRSSLKKFFFKKVLNSFTPLYSTNFGSGFGLFCATSWGCPCFSWHHRACPSVLG